MLLLAKKIKFGEPSLRGSDFLSVLCGGPRLTLASAGGRAVKESQATMKTLRRLKISSSIEKKKTGSKLAADATLPSVRSQTI